ncbi:hypothetical protein Hte_002556 [Hypoxylon texense]
MLTLRRVPGPPPPPRQYLVTVLDTTRVLVSVVRELFVEPGTELVIASPVTVIVTPLVVVAAGSVDRVDTIVLIVEVWTAVARRRHRHRHHHVLRHGQHMSAVLISSITVVRTSCRECIATVETKAPK